MRTFFYRFCSALLCSFGLLLTTMTDGHAQETFEWRMATVYPRSTEGFGGLYQQFADKVEEMSAGRLVINIVFDGEGVGAGEVLSAVTTGVVEMGAPFMPFHAGEIPAGIIETGLPGVALTTVDVAALYFETEWADILREEYAKHNAHWLGEVFYPGTYALTSVPINTLQDLSGLKLRALGAYGEFLQAFGVSPVTMPYGEIYTALLTKVVDGVAGSPIIDIHDAGFHEQIKYLFPYELTPYQTTPVVVNVDAWESLPADLKGILEAGQLWMMHKHLTVGVTLVDEALRDMKAAGLEWGPALSEEEQRAWIEAGAKLWDTYAAKDETSARLIAALREFMASR